MATTQSKKSIFGVSLDPTINIGHLLFILAAIGGTIAWQGETNAKIAEVDRAAEVRSMKVIEKSHAEDAKMQAQMAKTTQILDDLIRRIEKNEKRFEK